MTTFLVILTFLIGFTVICLLGMTKISKELRESEKFKNEFNKNFKGISSLYD